MRSNYKNIGDFIKRVDVRNEDLNTSTLLGVNLKKEFMPSVANTIGTDLSKYKVITKGQFGCKLMSVGRDKMLPISRLKKYDKAIMSSAYFVFEVINSNELAPEYLFMWFKRSESDRFLWFLSGGDVRARITWEDLCSLPIKVPPIDEQRSIVAEYQTVTDRIQLNEQINTKLEETAQALYRHWFVDFEFPDENGEPFKSSGGKMLWNEKLEKNIPEEWEPISIKEFTREMKSGGTPNRGVDEYWNSNDIPWLKTGELKNKVIIDSQEYISEIGLAESSAKLLPLNSVLVAMYGQGNTKGQIGYLRTESSTNQACCSMQCSNEKQSSYLYYYLRENRDEIVSVAIGGAQPNLSKEIIENLVILNPPSQVLEKHCFVDILNKREFLYREEQKLNSLKDLILSKMATNNSLS